MISNEQHDVVRSASGHQTAKPGKLAEFDGQRMAIIVRKGRQRIVLRGEASYVDDDAVGNSLQIRLDDAQSGQPVLILAEDQWDGRVIPDFHYGCEFCLVIE